MPDDKPDYTLAGILKSILISRNAPEGKYSTKPSKINITYQPLYPKEYDIIIDLKNSINSLKRYNKPSPKEVEKLIDNNYYKV